MANYQIEYSRRARENLLGLGHKHLQVTVAHAIREQLSFEPDVETRNRKKRKPNPLALWQLRVGDVRVFYDLEDEPEPKVHIVAIGMKIRDRLCIGGEEYVSHEDAGD